MASTDYAFNERIFARKDPINFGLYAARKKDLYNQYIEGGSSENAAQDSAGLIARRQFFAAAERAGAASDTALQQATAPTPASTTSASRTTPLSTAQRTRLAAPSSGGNEPSIGRLNLNVAPPEPKKVQATTGNTKKDPLNDNILHNYVNYTYRLSLYAIKNSEFNKLVVNPYAKVSKSLILSSGGSLTKEKDVNFKEDFYFEDLNLTTIIGLNARSRETNAIDLTFTIFEPNGCTLIDRLITLTRTIAGAGTDNYLSMPYILQIDFLGYDEAGTPAAGLGIIPGISKTIPLTLIEMKIKPDLAGTRYTIRGVPFNHLALTKTIGSIPINCEVRATNVQQLFQSTGEQGAQEAAGKIGRQVEQFGQADRDAAAAGAAAEGAALANARTDNQITQAQRTGQAAQLAAQQTAQNNFRAAILVTSLSDVLNGWNLFLVKEGVISVPDQYDVEFEPAIGNAKIILPQLNPSQDIPTSDARRNTEPAQRALRSSTSSGIAESAANLGVYKIFAGSAITNIISHVVKNSDYIRDQILEAAPLRDPATARDTQQGGVQEPMLSWFKVTPSITLLDFDQLRNQYAKKIVYKVSTYTYPNPRYPFAPQGQATKAVKHYWYWYTGQNSDILNVDIAFDTAFYTAVSLPLSTSFEETNPRVIPIDPDPAAIQRRRERALLLRKTGLPFPVIQNPTKNLADQMAASKKVDKKSIAVEDLAESLMTKSSHADMANIKLDIVGDPDFIKQDGLFGNTETSSDKTQNGSIITDQQRVIVNFNFKYPKDWNRSTGLLLPENQTVFNGLYAVIRVDSKFERGLFKQTLEMNKLFEENYKVQEDQPAPRVPQATPQEPRINPLTREVYTPPTNQATEGPEI